MSLIFVYGSLLSGLGNHRLLKTAKFISKGKTLPHFTMISLGGFPGLLSGGKTSIVGEVYQVDLKTRDQLDRLEGHPRWYVRTPITLADGMNVEVYVYPSNERSGHPIVVSGDWKAYHER